MRRVRAVVLALVVVANLIAALPTPAMKEADLDDPEFLRRELAGWDAVLSPVVPYETLQYTVSRAAWGWKSAVRWMRWPFQPLFDLTKTNQQWGLFAVVSEAPEALVVEVRRNGEWETLYRRLDPAHDWHDGQLKYRRIRGVWDSVKEEPKGTYKRLASWIARTVFMEQPDVDRVRVLLEKRFLTLPWEPPDPETRRRAEKYHRRERMMEPEPVPADPPEADE